MHLACSREGAGIGEGIAWLLTVAAVIFVVVIAVAVISGIVVGSRRKAVGKQVLKHLVAGVVVLILLPPLAYVAFEIRGALVHSRVQRDQANAEAWLQPLKDAQPGGLGAAIERVIANGDWGPNWPGYLVLRLQDELDAVGFDPTDADRAVLADLPARMERELARSHTHTAPGNLQALKGSASWLRRRPDLAQAAADCNADDECLRRVATGWQKRCQENSERCRAETPEATLDGMIAQYAAHYSFHATLLAVRQRWTQAGAAAR